MQSSWITRGGGAPFIVFLAAWLGASGMRPAAAADSEKLVAEVKVAWEKREVAARTVRMAWGLKRVTPKGSSSIVFPTKDGKVEPPADVSGEGKVTILIDGLSARCSRSIHAWSSSTQQLTLQQSDEAVVGGVLKSLNRFSEQDWPKGIVKKKNWVGEGMSLSDLPPYVAVRGTQPNVMGIHALAAFTEARRATLDGVGVIELITPRTEARGESKIWVSPTSDYSLVRFESYEPDGKLTFRLTVVPQQHPSGVWLPATWVGYTFANQRLLSTDTATMTAIEIAPPVSPGDFELAFPAGTWVMDDTGSKVKDYLVKEDGQQRPILQEELRARYEDLVRTEPGAIARKSALARNWRMGVAGVVLLIAAVLVTFKAARRARRGTDSGGG